MEKAVQAAIYEKALKNHYIEILYIDFEDTGKCTKLHQDTNLLNGENIFPESDEQMFDDYICEKIMRYASGNIEDLNRVKQQMTMEAITQGTAEHIMHHVMINFMLNGEMRFMQFDFTRESADTKNVFLFVEDYTVPQQQAFIITLRSIENSAVLFCILSEEEDAKTTLCYEPVFITRGFADMMETTQQQMMLLQKKPFCETVHPDDQQYVEESVRSLSIEHPHTNIFYRKRNPQGKWFYMQSDFSYLIVGKKKYIYVTYQDVSALQKNKELSNALHYSRKRDEELTNALEALGTVFTNIFLVHLENQKVEWLKIQADKENVLKQCQNVCEIRKLIHDNYMLPECQEGYLEFTDLDTLSERFEKHKILRYIYRNRNRQWIEVSAIVQNRDENGRVTDQRERKLQQEDALRIALAVVHENVITDRLRLNQILLNIVSNAIKFTPVGGMVNIRVSEKPCNRKGFTTFEFRIRDNGIGMSEEFQAHVFDSFSRERSSTQSGIKGTGLGMAITRNIVDMMGGTISMTSKEGKGTEFVVSLNFKTLEKATVYGPILALYQTERENRYSGKKVLLVEDNELNREIATALLEEIGISVDSVEDGTDAVERMNEVEDDRYDLIFMDIQMPKMDGYMATREIRTLRNNKKANIPIVAMTANAFEEDKKKAFKAGMNAHVAKPIDINTILAVFDQVFGTL